MARSARQARGRAQSRSERAEVDKSTEGLAPLRMVYSAAKRYPGLVAGALIALTVTAAATLAIPAGFRLVIDRGFAGSDDPGEIGRWFRYLLLIVIVLAVGTGLRYYFVASLGERVVADIRRQVQANLLRLSPGFFEENAPSEIASRMTADTTQIEVVVGSTISVALRNAIMATGGIAYLLILAPQLTVMLLAGVAAIIVPIVWFGRRIRRVSRESQDKVAAVGSITTEVLGAMKIVQGFNQEERERARFARAVEANYETAQRRIRLRSMMTTIVISFVFGAITLLLWDGAIQVVEGRLTGGTIAAFVLTGLIVAGAFGSLTEVYGDLVRGAGAAERLGQLLAQKPTIAAPARPLALPEPARGGLAFQNVTFSYPTRPSEQAVQDISLTIEPGETVAIVGPSGAGKSTMFQLACRFYDPQTGTVRLDGVPLTGADPGEVRRRIALVPQEGILFAANARDNLRYGAWAADDEAIWEAARAAHADVFLKALPQGLDTFLGEGGARLSGGQRQRIAIARALLRDAPILLLDEATSSLDAESENLVQQALERLMADRTTLVIAHRLATVRAADRIVVMDSGRIVEEGDHASLVGAGGLYTRLASLQFDEAAAA